VSGSNGCIAGLGTGGAGCDKGGGSGSNGEAGNFIDKPKKDKKMSRSQTITVYLPSDREWLMRQLEIVVADTRQSISAYMLDALESALKAHGITKETKHANNCT
jgi:hypothetical protein